MLNKLFFSAAVLILALWWFEKKGWIVVTPEGEKALQEGVVTGKKIVKKSYRAGKRILAEVSKED